MRSCLEQLLNILTFICLPVLNEISRNGPLSDNGKEKKITPPCAQKCLKAFSSLVTNGKTDQSVAIILLSSVDLMRDFSPGIFGVRDHVHS